LARSPVIFSVPWLSSTWPLSVVMLLGALKPLNESACTTRIGWLRSSFRARAGCSSSAPSTSRASRSIPWVRKEDAVDVMEKFQVVVREVGAHADPVHSTVALRELGGLGRFQAVFARPRGDFRGLHAGI